MKDEGGSYRELMPSKWLIVNQNLTHIIHAKAHFILSFEPFIKFNNKISNFARQNKLISFFFPGKEK